MILDYPNQPPRSTDDAGEIATLLRKGWITRPPAPEHDSAHIAVWGIGQWEIREGVSDAELRATIITQIKQAARQHILGPLPEWKQANATARALQITRTEAVRELTAQEQAELAALEGAWAWVVSVRAASDVEEAAVAQMTREQLDAWTMPALPEWPA